MLGCGTGGGVTPSVAVEGEVDCVVQCVGVRNVNKVWDGDKVFCVVRERFWPGEVFGNDMVGFAGGSGDGFEAIGSGMAVVGGWTGMAGGWG